MPEAGNFSITKTLLRSAKDGNQEALSRLLEHYRPILTKRIRLMMRQNARRHAETGDFLQGVFLEILRRLDKFEIRDDRSFVAWATEIARNSIRNRAKKNYERAFSSFVTTTLGLDLGTRSQDPAEEAVAIEQQHRLAESIEKLEEDHQEIILLRHVEGLSFVQIGERMQRSENAAQLLHARALSRLSALAGD